MSGDNYQQPPPQGQYYQPPPQQYYAPPPKTKTGMPTAAGILLILAGIQALVMGILVAFVGSALMGSDFSYYGDVSGYGFEGLFLVCGVLLLVFGILAMVGGIFAVQRKSWGFALMGAIFGLFTIGFLFTGSILSLVALILLAVSREEFR